MTFKKIGIIVSAIGLLIITAVLIYGYQVSEMNANYFEQSGYVLVAEQSTDTTEKQASFLTGTNYQTTASEEVNFTDIQGTNQTVEDTSFVHYGDGSISALSDGVVANLEEVTTSGFMNYYYLPAYTTLSASGTGYQADSQGITMDFSDFIWKIDEDKYMLVSESLDIHFSDDDVRTVSGFVEISYIDSGVVCIQTEENLWQTISPNCYVILSSGDIIDLTTRCIYNSEGELSFSLANMVIDADDNIEIQNLEQVELADLQVPIFDITAEDGEDGQAGEAGEAGESGEVGDEGASGDSGESGSDGSTGSTGTTGGTGGTGTSGSTSTTEQDVIPTFTVTDWVVSATNISCYIEAYDPSVILLEEDCTISIINNDTNEVVFETTHNFFATSFDGTLPDVGELTPDTEYRLVVYGGYILNDTEYYKEFVSKSFYTDSAGVSLEGSYATSDSLTVTATRREYSLATEAYIYLFDNLEDATNFDPTSSTSVTYRTYLPATFGTTGTEEEISKTFDVSDYSTVTTDQEYYFRITYKIEGETTLGTDLVTMETLKEYPTIDAPTVVVNRSTYSFDVYPDVSDPDGGITEYTYYVYYESEYDINGRSAEVQATYSSTSGDMTSISLLSSGLSSDVYYVVVLEVTFYDNEKEVQLYSEASNAVAMTGGMIPTVEFQFSESDGIPTGTYGSVYTSIYHESILGGIILNANSGTLGTTSSTEIEVSDELPITVAVSAPGVYYKILEFGGNDVVDYETGVITIDSINLDSLMANTQYTFTVYGWVDYKDGNGTTYTKIGSFVVATSPATSTYATWISYEEHDTSAFAVNVTFSNAQDSDGNEVENSAYVMSTASVLKVSLYRGTVVSEDTLQDSFVITDTQEEKYSSDISDNYYKDSASYSEGLTITNADFTNTSITSGTYTIAITELSDYTALTVDGSSSLGEEYLTSYSNEIPVQNSTYTVVAVNSVPDLPEDGYGIDVLEEITNAVVADYGGVYDPSLPDDTVVGYRIASTYNDENGLARNVKYYVFENNEYRNFDANEYSESDYEENTIYQVEDTIDPMTTGISLYETGDLALVGGKVPEVVFLFGDQPSDATITSGTYVSAGGYYLYYTGDYDDSTGTGVSRGMQLTFSYSMGVNTTNGTTAEEYYPQCVTDYEDATTGLPTTTSEVVDLPKSLPLVYAYPWASDTEYSVWKYWISDPDGTLSENTTENIEWLCEGVTYKLSTASTLLPGLDISVTDFLDENYKDTSSSYTNARIEVADTTGITDDGYIYDFEEVVIPIGEFVQYSDLDTLQMSVEIALYNSQIYASEDDLDSSVFAYENKDSSGNLIEEINLFRIDNTSSWNAVLSDEDTLVEPSITLSDETNLYTFDFSVVFGDIDDEMSTDVSSDLEETVDSSVLELFEEEIAGVKITFSAEDTNANLSPVILYKTLNDENKVYVSLTEVATLAGQEVKITIEYLSPNANIGLSVVGITEYAVREYGTDGSGGSYYISNLVGNGLQLTYNALPVMGSFFYSDSTVTSLGSSVNITVKERITGSSITTLAIESFVNMYSTEENSYEFITPVGLASSYTEIMDEKLIIDYGTPTIELSTTSVVQTINSIEFGSFTLAGAGVDNVGNTMYFTIYNASTNEPVEYESGNIYWPVSINGDGTYSITFSDLERDTNYVIRPYVHLQAGSAAAYTQLIDGTSLLSALAIYYYSTNADVSITNTSIIYANNTYLEKYLQFEYAVSQVSGFYMEYEIWSADTYDQEDSDELVMAIYTWTDTSTIYNIANNIRTLALKPTNGADCYLDSGDYILVIKAVSSSAEDNEAVLGKTEIEFNIPEQVELKASIATSNTVTVNDADETISYGLNISVMIMDANRVLTTATAEYQGDYMLLIYNNETGELVHQSGIKNTGLATTYTITGLSADTIYDIYVFAIEDRDLDGMYIDESLLEYQYTLLSLEEEMAKLMTVGDDEADNAWLDSIPGYMFYSQTSATTLNSSAVYGDMTITNFGTEIGVQFEGAVGLESNIDFIKYYIWYPDANGTLWYTTILVDDPTFTAIDEINGVYRTTATGFTMISSGIYSIDVEITDIEGNVTLLDEFNGSLYIN